MSKLSRDGSRLLYSTYIGGSVFDFGQSIAVDSDGRAYISGGTFSPNFPTTSGAPQTTIGVDLPRRERLRPGCWPRRACRREHVRDRRDELNGFASHDRVFQANLHGPANGFVTRIQLWP